MRADPKPTKQSEICHHATCKLPATINGFCQLHYWDRKKRLGDKWAKEKKEPKNKAIKKLDDSHDLKKLVKKLDTVFSLYIRLKDCDKGGLVRCFVTGKLYPIDKIQAGHYMSRRHYATRWSELNVKPQSVASNIFAHGQQALFGNRLDEVHGEGTALMLQQQANNKYKLDRFVLLHLIQEYSDRVKERKAELLP